MCNCHEVEFDHLDLKALGDLKTNVRQAVIGSYPTFNNGPSNRFIAKENGRRLIVYYDDVYPHALLAIFCSPSSYQVSESPGISGNPRCNPLPKAEHDLWPKSQSLDYYLLFEPRRCAAVAKR